jgi:trigger factor
MSKVISFEQTNPNTFALNYLVDAEEFQKIKETSVEQALKDVEVEGFRKGKAPKELAMSKIEPVKLENLILQNTFKDHEKPAVDAGRAELEKKGRHFTTINLNFGDGATKELEDGSFQFQLIFTLIPQVDVSKIDQIKLPELSPDIIPGRPKLEDFVEQEKNKLFCNFNRYEPTEDKSDKFYQVTADLIGKEGEKVVFEEKDVKVVLGLSLFLPEVEKALTGVKKGQETEALVDFPKQYPNEDLAGKKVKVAITVKSVAAPQYTTLGEVFEKSKQATELQKQFGSADQVEAVIKSVYERETISRLQNIRQRQIVQEVMNVVPDFELNEELVKSEIERLESSLKQKAEENKTALGEEFAKAFAVALKTEPAKMTEKQVREHLEKQVRNEFKWANILSFIYQTQMEDKPKPEDFEEVKNSAQKEPEKYGFSKDTPQEQIENAIVDRVVRQVAFTWIANQLNKTASKSEPGVTDVESKAKAKKTEEPKAKKPAAKKK